MLTIIPQGGMCNRLRVIDSSIGLSGKLGVPLRIIWQQNAECNCAFRRLFDLTYPATLVERGSDLPPLQEFWFGHRALARLLKRGDFLEHADLIDDSAQSALAKDLAVRDATVRTFETFHQHTPPLDWVHPTREIEAKVAETVSLFGPSMIGVHIRRTDNTESIRFGPTEEFVRRMRAALAENPRVKFFVATDSPETEQLLRAEFGEAVITRKKRLGRNDPEAIVDALVDVCCLSRTSRIIGSYWSTFSITAAQLGRIPLTVVKTPEPNELS
jgi:hypothetical protein